MGCDGRLTGKVIVLRVLLVQHCCGNVWNVAARIALAGHVDFVIFDPKGRLPVLEELDEILSNVLLGPGGDFADRKACADGLLNPKSHFSLLTNTLVQARARHTRACLLDSPMS